VWDVWPGSFADREAEQPPRRASAEPEPRHVGCFCAAVGVPSFDPRPERKRGRGSKLGGRRAPVGRCLRAGGVLCRSVRAFPCFVLEIAVLRFQKPIFLRGGSGGGAISWRMALKTTSNCWPCCLYPRSKSATLRESSSTERTICRRRIKARIMAMLT
jgi:hypothetical protein